MKLLITGSSGHLGEGLMRTLQGSAHEVVGIDLKESQFTTHVGTIADRDFVRRCMHGVDAVIHTATLHKPHIGTHSKQDFIDTNITGTLNLLEEAVAAGVSAFIFTSTTSAFGRALQPPPGVPAAWITEDVRPISKNIYGATKLAAEDLCELVHREHKLPCLILRTSRFFPEADDNPEVRGAYEDANVKANEFLHRRVDVQDVVDAHLSGAGKGRVDRFRQVHHQCDFAARAKRPGRTAQRLPESGRAICSGVYQGLFSSRMENVPQHRPGVCERARPQRT